MRRITGLAMAAVLALAAGACGGDDASSDPTTTARDDSTTTTTDDGATTDGSSDGTTDDLAAGFLDEDCQFLIAGAYLNPLAALVPGADADLEANAQKIEDATEAAPEEVQDAMATIADGYAAIADIMKDVDFTNVQSLTDPDVQQALTDAGDIFDEDYQAAAETVNEYVTANCSG